MDGIRLLYMHVVFDCVGNDTWEASACKVYIYDLKTDIILYLTGNDHENCWNFFSNNSL